jgi:uncharacterized protein YkwD
MIATLIAAYIVGAAGGTAVHLPQTIAIAIRRDVIDDLNAYRRKAGASPLGLDAFAQTAAQQQADDMAAAGMLRHNDEYGRLPMTRYQVLGGDPRWYGENVGYFGIRSSDYAIVKQIVERLDALMMAERPPADGHRKNILSGRFDAVGIGLALGPKGIYLAEDFVGYKK